MISFVYFDVGGVLIKDFSGNDGWLQLKKDLGVNPKQDLEFDKWFDELEEQICVGLPADIIIPQLKSKWKLNIPDNYSLQKDMVSRFGSNGSINPVIQKIRSLWRTGLLTNMYPGFLEDLEKRNLLHIADWETVIDSSVEKVAKPNPRIFEIAQQKAVVPGSEILFIENTKRHIESAKSLGWQTFWYDSKNPEQSSQDLLEYIDGCQNA